MKALCVTALLLIALPAAAQEAKPLPPDSFKWDGYNRRDLRDFSPPTPPTIIPAPQTGLMTLPVSPMPPAPPPDARPAPPPEPRLEPAPKAGPEII
jgi:hypothetical protein